jgi:hypothetical protein
MSPYEAASRIAQTAGLAAALLYAAGALELVADLRAAGVSAADVFPIIPIEQHLARALELLVSPRGLLIALLLVVTSVVLDAMSHRRGHGEGEPEGLAARVSRAPWAAVVLLAAAYLVLLFLRPIVCAQQAASVAGLYGLTRMRPGRQVAVSTRVLAIMFGLLFGFVLREYLTPQPLPQASVVLEGGAPIHGRFIAVVDNSWYLASTSGAVIAGGEKHVVSAQIVPPQQGHDWKDATLPGLLGG